MSSAAAYVRQAKERKTDRLPHFSTQNVKIPSFFAGLQYADCREADLRSSKHLTQDQLQGFRGQVYENRQSEPCDSAVDR